MRIAVCDDETAALEAVVTCLENYMLDRRVELEYALFDHYKKLKPQIGAFDVFVLDYQMPDVNGLEFARLIREQYGTTKTIIFISSFQEIVYDAFYVRTHRFLVKPVEQEKFYEAMDSCIRDLGDEKYVLVKSDGVSHVLRAQEILYIEAQKKECVVRCEDARLTVGKPISLFEEELEPYGFFRAHRSYLINLKKIKRFDSRTVTLVSGETLDISARRYAALCKAYLKLK